MGKSDHAAKRDLCTGCGDPALVCPAIPMTKTPTTKGSRLVRCCEDCSHRGPADEEWAEVLAYLATPRRQARGRRANPGTHSGVVR